MGILVENAASGYSERMSGMNNIAASLCEAEAQDEAIAAQEHSNNVSIGCTVAGCVVVVALAAVAVW